MGGSLRAIGLRCAFPCGELSLWLLLARDSPAFLLLAGDTWQTRSKGAARSNGNHFLSFLSLLVHFESLLIPDEVCSDSCPTWAGSGPLSGLQP